MKITLLSDESIRLEPVAGVMTIEALSPEQSYSPFHMLASSLAYCTWSVLASWASHIEVDADDLIIEVRWSFAEKPHRVGEMALTYSWPSLPENRRAAAKRAAALCAVHATLTHPPAIAIEELAAAGATAAAAPTPAGVAQ